MGMRLALKLHCLFDPEASSFTVAAIVRDELDEGAIISCPPEFNDRFVRYDVTLAWTLEITPLVLGLINRFVIRTLRVDTVTQAVVGFFGDDIDIIHEVRLYRHCCRPDPIEY